MFRFSKEQIDQNNKISVILFSDIEAYQQKFSKDDSSNYHHIAEEIFRDFGHNLHIRKEVRWKFWEISTQQKEITR